MSLEGQTNDWPSHSQLSSPFIRVILQPHLPLIQLGPWRSQIFVDIFWEIVASKYAKFIGKVKGQQTHTHAQKCLQK